MAHPGDEGAAVKRGLGFDPDELRRKYLSERDKRLRSEAVDQYIRVAGQFRRFAEDPWTEPGFTRDPVEEETDVLILGGGFAGVLTAVRLREAGVDSMRLIEKGGDFGGTWYWNRYPGIRCDIESYIYMPLLEETGYIPTEKYARGSEIFAHFRRIAEKYDLYDRAYFQTQITAMRFDEEISRWIVRTNRHDTIRARFICLGGAGLHRPKLPGVPGIESFRGHAFHTSRWDYGYTGGDPTGNLSGLRDKRVAVVGTGATGVQVVPNIAPHVEHLYVIQRTAPTVDVRNNRPTDPDWAASLEPGWQSRRIDNFTALLGGIRQDEDLVGDAWTDIARKLALFTAISDNMSDDDQQLADYRKMEELRARIDAIVADPATAEGLKPWYNYRCKRPCFSDEYLQAFNRPNVTLVATDGRGPDRFTEHTFEFDGVSHEIDCLIFATGFDTFMPIYESGEFELIGRNGQSLAEAWRHGVRTVHGICVNGFPNMFITGGKPQAASTANVPHITDAQAKHVAAVISTCLRRHVKTMEVSRDAERRWAEVIAAKRINKEDFFGECTPSYLNFEGAKDRPSLLAEAYGGGMFSYLQDCARWREKELDRDAELTLWNRASPEPTTGICRRTACKN